MEEDEAFWTLSCIVEDLLPDSFYADNMSSLLEELELFDELTRTKHENADRRERDSDDMACVRCSRACAACP